MTHQEVFHGTLDALLNSIREKSDKQFAYNIATNTPAGIVKREDAITHALESGLVSAIGAHVHWDIDGALNIAADIAEDVNAHAEAATIRALVAGNPSQTVT